MKFTSVKPPPAVMGAWPTCSADAWPRQRVTWFQNTWSPFSGIGNGVPPIAPVKPLPSGTSFAVVALRLVASYTASGDAPLRCVG